jgi:hypothetical protein
MTMAAGRSAPSRSPARMLPKPRLSPGAMPIVLGMCYGSHSEKQRGYLPCGKTTGTATMQMRMARIVNDFSIRSQLSDSLDVPSANMQCSSALSGSCYTWPLTCFKRRFRQ